MSAISSISAVTASSFVTEIASDATQAALSRPASGSQPQDDTVELSADFEAVRLYGQGQSEDAIAHTLDTTTHVVDGYLGLTLEKELQQALQPPAKS